MALRVYQRSAAQVMAHAQEDEGVKKATAVNSALDDEKATNKRLVQLRKDLLRAETSHHVLLRKLEQRRNNPSKVQKLQVELQQKEDLVTKLKDKDIKEAEEEWKGARRRLAIVKADLEDFLQERATNKFVAVFGRTLRGAASYGPHALAAALSSAATAALRVLAGPNLVGVTVNFPRALPRKDWKDAIDRLAVRLERSLSQEDINSIVEEVKRSFKDELQALFADAAGTREE